MSTPEKGPSLDWAIVYLTARVSSFCASDINKLIRCDGRQYVKGAAVDALVHARDIQAAARCRQGGDERAAT